MKRAHSLAAGALAAALLVGGAGGGTTLALWRDEAALDGGTISAGTLDVAVARDDESSVNTRKYGLYLPYTVSAHVAGDNLVSLLRIRFAVNPELDRPGEVATEATITAGGTSAVVSGSNPQELVVGVLPHGSTWDGMPGIPMYEADAEGTVDIPVLFSVTQVDRAGVAEFFFPGGDLIASLEQLRPGTTTTETTPGLWSVERTAVVPSTGSASASSLSSDAARAGSVDDPAPESPHAEADPTPDSAAQPVTPEPEDEQVAESEDVPVREEETSDEEESAHDEESASDEHSTSDETPAFDETPAPEETPEARDAEPEPDWADELLEVMDEAGIDPDTIDPTELPAEIEEWATENEIPVDEIVAWLERRTS